MGKKQTAAACSSRGGGEDFLIEILLRLPVTSLLRFKSVCKSWRDLIQSSFFIHLHTDSSFSSSSNFGSFIFQAHAVERSNRPHYYLPSVTEILMLSESESESCEYGDWYWGTDGIWHKFPAAAGDWHWDNTNCCWYWVNHEVFKVDNDDQLLLKFDYLGQLPPSCYELFYSEAIIGSCNGLVCLYESCHKTVSLWNPATRHFRRLPESITIEKRGDWDYHYHYDFVAFGFDIKTKDYKVVKITYFHTISTKIAQCRVQVYSLSTDSWRLLEGINSLPGLPMFGHNGLYLNGSCSFIVNVISTERKLYDDRLIISFDFTKEIFTTMQFPDDHQKHDLYLSCLGGGDQKKMALFTTLTKTSSSYGYEDCDIWVLNEQGRNRVNKVDSWIKLHSFQIKNTRGFAGGTKLRGVSNNGKFALLETSDSRLDSGGLNRRMQLYNLITKEAKMDLLLCQGVSSANVYKPSLVSIIGGNGAAPAAPSDNSV